MKEELHKPGHLVSGELTLKQTEQTRKTLSRSVRRDIVVKKKMGPVSLADFGWKVGK